MSSKKGRQVFAILAVTFILVIGYAAARGWISGDLDFGFIERDTK